MEKYIALLLAGGLHASFGEISSSNVPPPMTTAKAVVEPIVMLEASGELRPHQRNVGLAGIDADNNGIRDDVDDYINAKDLPAGQKEALAQHARALQASLLVDLANESAVHVSLTAIARGVSCIWRRLGRDSAAGVVTEIKKVTMNTRDRVVAYGRLAGALNGTVISRPSGDTCETNKFQEKPAVSKPRSTRLWH